METAFYVAGKAVAKKLAEMVESDEAIRRRARRLARSLGAKAAYWNHSFLGREVTGFKFAEPPGKRFVKLKGTSDGWKPRRSRENRELISQMDELRTSGTQAVGEIAGLKTGQLRFDCTSGKMRMSGGAGLERAGTQFILEIYKQDGEPVGCRRISDIQRERLLNGANAKRGKSN